MSFLKVELGSVEECDEEEGLSSIERRNLALHTWQSG